MMKAIFRLAASVAAISMVALSCAKIEQPTVPVGSESEIEEPADGDFVVTFECSLPEGEKEDGTKTSFNENQSKISWSIGDKVRFSQCAFIANDNSYAINSKFRELDSGNLTSEKLTQFNVTFTDPEISENKKGYYYSIYPNEQVKATSFQTGEMWCCLTLPSNQTPEKITSYDPLADLLISELKVVETKPQNILLRYTHVVAFGKMTIKNLQSSNPVRTIEFSAKKGENDVPVAGTRYYNINEGVADEQKTDDKCSEEHKITLNYTSDEAIASGDGFTAYFCCYPFELGKGDSFKVVVTTTAGEIITKNVSLQDKQLAFNQSKGSKFTVDMSNATKTCSWFEIFQSTSADNRTINQIKTAYCKPNGSTTQIKSIYYIYLKSIDYNSNTDYFQQEGSYKTVGNTFITDVNNGDTYSSTHSDLDIDTEYTILYKATNEDNQSVILKRTARTDWFKFAVVTRPSGGVQAQLSGVGIFSGKKYQAVKTTDIVGSPEQFYDNTVKPDELSDNIINAVNNSAGTAAAYAVTKDYKDLSLVSNVEYTVMIRVTNTRGETVFRTASANAK